MDIEPLAGRFEFGTMAYGCALGLGKAVEFILGLGSDAIFDHALEVLDQAFGSRP